MNSIFYPEVIFDGTNNNYTITVKELGAEGHGQNIEDAVDMLMDEIDSLALAFFDSPEFYLDRVNYERYYDYFIDISRFTKKDFIQSLGIKH